jgi:hypothetical protein
MIASRVAADDHHQRFVHLQFFWLQGQEGHLAVFAVA